MQNFSKIKVTITVLHSKNKIMSVFPPIQNISIFFPFVTAELMLLSCFYMKHKTKLKCKRNMASFTHVVVTMHSYQLKCLTELMLVMRKQHSTATVNLVTLYFQHITIVEYQHVIAITSLFPKLILLYIANMLLGIKCSVTLLRNV